jgi:hypothetical protein
MFRILATSCTGLVLFVVAVGFGCDAGPRTEPAGADLSTLPGGPQPQIQNVAISDCLLGSRTQVDEVSTDPDEAPPQPSECGEEQIELSIRTSTLEMLHRNAIYNCCLDDIEIDLSVEGTVIRLTEQEVLANGGCRCLCCYDVQATVVGLAPGRYTVGFCWAAGGQECRTEDVVIP